MTLRHQPAWIELIFLGGSVAGLIGALTVQVWLGAAASGLLAGWFLPRVWDGISGLKRGLPWEGREFELTFLPSRAQQFAICMPFMLGYTLWRIVDSGWLGAAINAPFLVGYVIWFVHVLRTEGWSGSGRGAHGEEASREA
ncbi:MAG: hypothetical protein WEE64_06115 [Dehalococcoidia bacterium]